MGGGHRKIFLEEATLLAVHFRAAGNSHLLEEGQSWNYGAMDRLHSICVQTFRKGIAEKKVRWVEDWVRRHLSSGGATGREVKAALGRLTFVAGALQMLRPFLGPLFSWAAVLRGGAFAKFPEAVHMLLKFIERCVREEPMTLARSVAFSAEEVFRGLGKLWGFQHEGGPLVFSGVVEAQRVLGLCER